MSPVLQSLIERRPLAESGIVLHETGHLPRVDERMAHDRIEVFKTVWLLAETEADLYYIGHNYDMMGFDGMFESFFLFFPDPGGPERG